jgi:dipeptidase
MCDTFVALPDHTVSGNLIFGKNSDREPNEAQAIIRLPATETNQQVVRCTFIQVPQVKRTYEVILSKPFQMWGAEMGVNEHGVVIGNEAVFTKIKIPKANDGLTGMDMVRLALERSKTAKNALLTIAELLESYGQDACGGYRNKNFFYHNSFLIADSHSAWVLETAGRHWVAQRVDGFRSISNGLTIGSDFDLISPDAVGFAVRKGWTKSRNRFEFRQAYSDWLYTKGSNCRARQTRTTDLGQSRGGDFDVSEAIKILRTHDHEPSQFAPEKSSSASICMHPTGMTNPSQTNGSMVVEIRQHEPATVWLTGTSMPCLSVYLPCFFGEDDTIENPLNESTWNSPAENPDDSLWWKAERLHRHVCRNYSDDSRRMFESRDELQGQFIEAEQQISQTSSALEKRLEFSTNAVERRLASVDSMSANATTTANKNAGYLYRYYWKRINRQAGIS